MADQKIGVILDFKANTSQAKQSMSQLQQLLTKVSSGADIKVNAVQLSQASQAAKELAFHLSAAYNVNTGKLDLGKLNASLNSAKTNIQDLSNKLLQAGTTGQQAFVQLAKSMSMAEAPAFKLNDMVTKLWGSLKNVATWQISSSILMGFTSAISDAYNFAQDLNESLTEIRIVTGKNTDEMKRFAKEANNAAKALSTTTTKYTDASLIYFQQGLSEKQVKERTDLTIKMANVTGQSVSEVSNQLTSVWNNFDDGSQSLEHYVDVMVALGAATASSSEEISEGLNKFAAVAETVGLSYEYAAAALATVTATTRESADIVGTAFKTLFARIQDLELGKTLDDGTTLGQYSQALAAVGINIKGVNGEIKDMNTILDEMGSKWNTLSKDSQIALAQNVAGVRQYTQLIALMDNWSYFQENLNTSLTSSGALSEQAEIYEESWRAARDRVTAALEDIYQDLLKDDFFINLTDGVADLIEGVDTFIERLGGIKPIIISLSSLLLNYISNKIQPALYQAIASIQSITATGAAKQAEKQSKPMIEKIDQQIMYGGHNQSDKTALENSKQLLQVKNLLWIKQKDMTEAEKQMAQIDLDLIENKQSELQSIADIITKLQEKISLQEKITIQAKVELQQKKALEEQEKVLQEKVRDTKKAYEENQQILKSYPELIKQKTEKLRELQSELDKTQKHTKEHDKIERRITNLGNERAALIGQLGAATKYNDSQVYITAYKEATKELENFQNANRVAQEVVIQLSDVMIQSYQKAGQAAAQAGQAATEAFLQGTGQVNLNDVADTFFESNKQLFEGRGNRATVSRSKTKVSGLRDTLGEEVIEEAGLGDKFNAVESASTIAELRKALDELKESLKNATVSSESFEKSIKNFGETGEQAVRNIQKPLEKLHEQQEQLSKQQKELNKQIANFKPGHIASGVEVFSKLTSGITSTAMAAKGVISLFNQLKEDGPPKTFEEWTSVIASVGFLVPQMANAYTALAGGLEAVFSKTNAAIVRNNALMGTNILFMNQSTGELKEMTLGELYNTAAKEAGANATEEQIRAKVAELAISGQLVAADGAEAFAEGVVTAAKQKGTIWTRLQTLATSENTSKTLLGAAAKKILALAESAGVIAINAETGAVTANTAAWYANPIMWIALVIIAVVAALVALTVHILKVTGALNKEATTLEKAQNALEAHTKALEAANEQLTEATQHLDDMRSLLKDISTTQDAFKMLVEGSTAWQENLEKNNEQILQLLELYPELANMFVNGEKLIDFQNGVYTVTDVGALVQYVEGNAKVAKDTAELAAIFAAWDKEVAAAEVDLEEKKQSRLENQRQLEAKFAQQMSSTISNGYNGRDTAKLTIGEHSIQRTNDPSAGIWMGQMQALATTIARDVVSTGISVEDKVNELRNTVGNEYSFVNEADWEFLATSIESISDSAEGVNLVAEAEENLAKARETIPAQLKVVANSILSTRKGYAQLSDAQKELATEIYTQQLVQNKQKNTITAASLTAELTQADMDKLARAVLGIDKSAVDASSDKWRDNRDAKGNKNVQTGDWGDYFSKTDEGAKVLDAYMQEVYQKGFDKTGAEFSAEGVTLGDNDGTTISFQAVIEWANAKAAIEELPTEELFAKVEAYSDEIAAAYTGNILDLTQEQVDALSASLEGVDFDKYNPLTMTPEELEGFTDSYAGEIMRLAADLGKMPAEILAVVQEQLLSYDAELAELRAIQRDIEAGNAFLAQSAEQFGLNASALETYTALLQEMYGTSYQQAAKAAVMNARYTKGIENLGKALADADESLIEWRDTGELTYETAESLNEIINALYDVFGVKVSTKFIDEYYDKLQILLKGGEEAVEVMQELELAAAKDYVASLYLKEDSEKAFNDILTKLQDMENDFEITGSVNLQDEGMLDTLNGMIASGEATAEQIQAAFEAIGWAPNFEVVTHTLPPQDTYTYTSTAAGGNNDDPTSLDYGKGGGEWTKVTTVSTVQGIGLNEKATIDYIGGRSGTTVSAGGGGSSSKSKSKKQNKEQYYQEKKAIDELQRALDKLSKAKDRAFGANKIAAIEAEILKLEEMRVAQENYTTAIKEQLLVDQKAINQLGFSTDANGIIKNYDEIIDQAWARYEAAVATGNDAVIETAKNQYDELIEATEQYNEALELFKNEQDKLLELQYELQDLALEKVTYEVEYKIELNEDDLKYLEWQLEKLNDPIDDAVNAISLLGKTLKENLDNIDIYKQGLTDIFKVSGLTEADIENVLSGKDLSSLDKAIFTEDQIEAIREYRDALYECYEALDAFYDQIMERVNEAFEKMNEEAEETVSKIEHLGSMLSSYQNIVDIVGAKALGMTKASLQALSKAQVESSKATLEALQTQLDANRSALDDLQAARKEAVERNDTEAIEKWDEQIKIVQQTISDLEESVNDAWGSALQAAAEDFQLAVELATQSFEEAMSGIYGSFEKMQEAYNQQREISQRYVSDYQKIYELSKLNRDLSKSISEIDSIKGKRALMELQEEINSLQESGVELSEHDLEFLQKKYELRQAEIALEEAQNAKSQVRMQRDAEGNWGYVYTADANVTAEAEQSYEDKLYEIQKLEQDYIDEMEAAAIQAQIDMINAINSIRREDFESEEAYMEAVNKVRQYYSGLYGYYIGEANKALSNSATIYENDWAAYSKKTGYKIVADQEWRDQFSETFTAQANGYKTADDAMVAFEQSMLSMCTKLKNAFAALELEFASIFSALGYSFEQFGGPGGVLDNTVSGITDELDSITDSLEGWENKTAAAFEGVVNAAESEFKEFQTVVEDYETEIENLITGIDNAIRAVGEIQTMDFTSKDDKKESDPLTPTGYTPLKTYPTGYTPPKTYPTGYTPLKTYPTGYTPPKTYPNQTTAYTSPKTYVTNTTTYIAPKTYVTNTTVYTPPKTYTSKGAAFPTSQLNSVSNAHLSFTGMATGGYTGAWGPEGRLALLHQKELVLNAMDTENVLSAINIVRDISKAIDLRVAAQQGGLNAISKAPIANTTTQTLQQEVTIHAEFPNATQRNEIEAAFDTLLNRASQFANRKV